MKNSPIITLTPNIGRAITEDHVVREVERAAGLFTSKDDGVTRRAGRV